MRSDGFTQRWYTEEEVEAIEADTAHRILKILADATILEMAIEEIQSVYGEVA